MYLVLTLSPPPGVSSEKMRGLGKGGTGEITGEATGKEQGGGTGEGFTRD